MAVRFPEIEGTKIDTKKFLLAADEFVDLIEKFGKLFHFVSSDMRNNIKKTFAVFNEDNIGNKYIQDLILNEKSRNQGIGTDAIMWLRRALHFTLRLFELIEEDINNGNKRDNISEFVKQAYKESLEPYHNWAAKKCFQLFYKAAPTRSQIIDLLTPGRDEDFIKEELHIFNILLRNCVMNLVQFYEENGFENKSVVG